MILYFTGIGNSRFVAKILTCLLNDEVVSINDYMKAYKYYIKKAPVCRLALQVGVINILLNIFL